MFQVKEKEVFESDGYLFGEFPGTVTLIEIFTLVSFCLFKILCPFWILSGATTRADPGLLSFL